MFLIYDRDKEKVYIPMYFRSQKPYRDRKFDYPPKLNFVSTTPLASDSHSVLISYLDILFPTKTSVNTIIIEKSI